MKSLIPRTSPLPVALCLLALAFPLTVLAQDKAASKTEKNPQKTPQADKTLSSKSAPVITIAPNSATTVSLSFMAPLEQEILNEMNLARTEPQKYAAFVEEFKKYYNGNKLSLPGRQNALLTSEGTAAVDEAISFLQAAKPQPAMAINRGMCQAAKDHANDLALKGITGHKGSDGSTPNARLERYGSWEGAVAENIVYDVSTAREIVIGLIIDDGTPNRGHRRNIFDSNHRVTGVSITDSPSNGAKCVLNYAGGYQEKSAPAATKAPAPKKL
ncbi:MAG: CAP domain-containing protein [Acidobacteriota bacterium]|nr:CAP domain-containing protein [Acidobacteriota bacterium]